MIDDIEHELDKTEHRYEEAKNEVGLKEKELNDLEHFVTKQVGEMNIMRDNNYSMVSQIAEKIQMEKKINVQKEVI